jgi:hypothetical protein
MWPTLPRLSPQVLSTPHPSGQAPGPPGRGWSSPGAELVDVAGKLLTGAASPRRLRVPPLGPGPAAPPGTTAAASRPRRRAASPPRPRTDRRRPGAAARR